MDNVAWFCYTTYKRWGLKTQSFFSKFKRCSSTSIVWKTRYVSISSSQSYSLNHHNVTLHVPILQKGRCWCLNDHAFAFVDINISHGGSQTLIVWKIWDTILCSYNSFLVKNENIIPNVAILQKGRCWCFYDNAFCFVDINISPGGSRTRDLRLIRPTL